jgi:N6-adenosine-specific RNA methylase IME4
MDREDVPAMTMRLPAADLFSEPLAQGGLPVGPYACILADPPWRMKMRSEKGMGRSPDGQSRAAQRHNRPENHYQTMDMVDLIALPIRSLAADDCVLVMWAIDPMLPQAIALGAAWGFTYKTVGFVWAKERRVTSKRGPAHEDPNHKRFPMGTGYWTRANPELAFLFTRGHPRRLSASVRKLLIAPRREHSRKPDEQYERIESLCAGPRLELFARQAWPGWDCWGLEAPEGPPAIGHDAEGPPTGRRRVRDAGETQIAPPGFSFNGGEDHGR